MACPANHDYQVGGKKRRTKKKTGSNKKSDLAQKNVEQLRRLAGRAHLKGRSSLTKARLVNALSKL